MTGGLMAGGAMTGLPREAWTAAAVACGTVCGLGLVAIGYGAVPRTRTVTEQRPAVWHALLRRLPADWTKRRVAVAAVAGVVAGALTAWPVAVVLTTIAVLTLPGLLGGDKAAARRTERMEALALWTEMLRDTLSAAAGLEQAVLVTADIAPTALGAELRDLAEQIRAGRFLPEALRAFAVAVDDPLADLTVAALVMAASKQAGQLGMLLGELAESVREQVAMYQRIDAGRASVRTAVRVTVITTLAMVVGLVVFNRRYLDPFDSMTGQLVLAVMGALFVASFASLRVIGRIEEPVRLITTSAADPGPASTTSGGSR
jgi:tight adherence protein B